MNTTRLEAFSDGVFAIIITIMVLELKVPHAPSWAALTSVWPVFSSYVLSFVNVGIYWNNHHHFLQAAKRLDGRVLWANLHLLFWLSIVPFTTAWMGENDFAPIPTAIYSADLLLCALAWQPFQLTLIRANGGEGSELAHAIGPRDWKGVVSPLLYLAAIPLAFVRAWISGVLVITVAVIWFVPDRRVEAHLSQRGHGH